MSSSQPPPSPPKQNGEERDADNSDKRSSKSAPSLGESTKKKSRLQWDEENLIHNAAEMERAGPRMKIDEPKTPYNMLSSENGSSTSGSAHQSPPESPSFIPRDRLVGFGALEQGILRRRNSTGNTSDGASSASSAGRSVHIDDNLGASAGSSPKSSDVFVARRRAHYRNEARVKDWVRVNEFKDDEDNDDNDNDDADNDNNDDACNNAIVTANTDDGQVVNADEDEYTDNAYNRANYSSANGEPATNDPSHERDNDVQPNGTPRDYAHQNGSADFMSDQGCREDHIMAETTNTQSWKLRERPLDQTNGCGKETDISH